MLTILVVDDDRMIRSLLNNCLRNAGHAVLIARDGREAFDLANEHPIDLILMDMNMPDMDGWTATRMIKHVIDQRLPIIALSAYGLPGDRARAAAAGCNRFLTKPIDAGLLLKEIDDVVKMQLNDSRP